MHDRIRRTPARERLHDTHGHAGDGDTHNIINGRKYTPRRTWLEHLPADQIHNWADLVKIVAEPPELSRLKCAGHHHKGNTGTNALQTEQFLVCRVTSRYNHRFSDRTSIPRTKASPEILQPQVLHHRHKSYYKPVLKHYYKTNLSKTVIQAITISSEYKYSGR